MKSLKRPNPEDYGLESFRDLLQDSQNIIGEEESAFETFCEGLRTSLMPMTAYEAALAENLIMLEWEILQLNRSIRSNLRQKIESKIKAAVINAARAKYRADMEAVKEEIYGRKSETERLCDDLYFIPPYDFDEKSVEAEAIELIASLASPDTTKKESARLRLKELNTSPEDIFAAQFAASGSFMETSDRVAALEARRRKLKEDYDRLQRYRPIDGDYSEE